MSGGALFVSHSALGSHAGTRAATNGGTRRFITTRYQDPAADVASPLAGLLVTETLNLTAEKRRSSCATTSATVND